MLVSLSTMIAVLLLLLIPGVRKPASTQVSIASGESTPQAQVSLSAPKLLGSTGRLYLDGPVPISTAHYSPTPAGDPLLPSSDEFTSVQWVNGLGVPPSRAEDGTVYLIGHAWSHGAYALTPLSGFVTARADLTHPVIHSGTGSHAHGGVLRYPVIVPHPSPTLTLVDNAGTSTAWRVTDIFLMNKDETMDDKELFGASLPGRLVLLTCAVAGGMDLHYNVVIVATIVR